MKRLFVLATLLFVFFCTGCTKRLPMEPSGPDDTLLVGSIRLYATGFETESNLPKINGEHVNNIELAFLNIINKEEIKMFSISGGFFYKKSLQPGIYGLTRLSITASGEYGSTTFRTTFSRPAFLVPVQRGKVTNLGGLLWYADNKSGETYVKQQDSPRDLRDRLAARFPESEWFAREWIEVEFGGSEEEAPADLPSLRSAGMSR